VKKSRNDTVPLSRGAAIQDHSVSRFKQFKSVFHFQTEDVACDFGAALAALPETGVLDRTAVTTSGLDRAIRTLSGRRELGECVFSLLRHATAERQITRVRRARG
jgi:hypothetical protein